MRTGAPAGAVAHRVARQCLDVEVALPDAAPADRVEVDPVDPSSERRAAARVVAIDVVERAARVESGVVPSRMPSASSAPNAGSPASPPSTGRAATPPARRGHRVGLLARVAMLVGVEQVARARGLRILERERRAPGRGHGRGRARRAYRAGSRAARAAPCPYAPSRSKNACCGP